MSKLKSFFLFLLAFPLAVTSCYIDRRHVEPKYDDYQNEDIVSWDDFITNEVTWENVTIRTFDDSDLICTYVYDTIMFEELSTSFPSVAAIEMDYRSSGKYFDGDLVYQMVGKKYDLNPLIAKVAIGTGVIVVCVVMAVATYGSTTPVACFIAGAAVGSIKGAIIGAAMGAATGAIASAIKSGGDWEETLYGTAEGSADGYMWGAIFGAIEGGWNSAFCFTKDTKVNTSDGVKNISDVKKGDYVYSYDEKTQEYSYNRVLDTYINNSEDFVKITTNTDTIEVTNKHPFYTKQGWVDADQLVVGDQILSDDYKYISIQNIEHVSYDIPKTTFNLSIDKAHTFLVGNDMLVAHNVCAKDFSGGTYHFPDGTPQATKYPNGIQVSPQGYPNFEPYAAKKVTFPYPSLEGKASGTCLTGNYATDMKMANTACGFKTTPTGFTWHHVEDMQTLLLVPQDIHSFMYGGLRHSGGASLIREFFRLLLT